MKNKILENSLFAWLILVVTILSGCASIAPSKNYDNRYCAKVREGTYAPANDWIFENNTPVPIASLGNTIPAVYPTIRPTCGQRRMKGLIHFDQRYLFQSVNFNVALNGKNLCVKQPHIFFNGMGLEINRLYEDLFMDERHFFDTANRQVLKIIKAQCGSVPEYITVEVIVPEPRLRTFRLKENARTTAEQIEYIKSLNAPRAHGMNLKYGIAYKGTLDTRSFSETAVLFGSALIDDPNYKGVREKIVSREENRISHIKKRRRAREKASEEFFAPIVVVLTTMLQKATHEFGDEGLCYFLQSDKRYFSKTDYIKCHNSLNNIIERGERDYPAVKALTSLIMAMKNDKNNIKVSQDNLLTESMYSCYSGVISYVGKLRYDEEPIPEKILENCKNEATFDTITRSLKKQ